jgi:small subunit ribosomal protein S8
MVTDPIADFLIRVGNALNARKESVSIPNSKMTRALAELLSREGYIGEVDTKKDNGLTISLLYKDGRPGVLGSKRISKLSRRMYMGVRDIKPIRHGHGLLVLSTPQGLMTGKEAREKRVGGEALFEIW